MLRVCNTLCKSQFITKERRKWGVRDDGRQQASRGKEWCMFVFSPILLALVAQQPAAPMPTAFVMRLHAAYRISVAECCKECESELGVWRVGWLLSEIIDNLYSIDYWLHVLCIGSIESVCLGCVRRVTLIKLILRSTSSACCVCLWSRRSSWRKRTKGWKGTRGVGPNSTPRTDYVATKEVMRASLLGLAWAIWDAGLPSWPHGSKEFVLEDFVSEKIEYRRANT